MLRILIISAMCLFVREAHAQNRLALVVGVDRYDSVDDLRKATSDAQSVASVLDTLGFSVTTALNVDELEFNREIDRLVSAVRPGDEVVFYFAGHGIEIDGLNYLLPSDAPDGSSERGLRNDSVDADRLLRDLRAAGSSVVVMILDACRDNPYAQRGRSIGGARGLNIVAAPEGSFVLLSAAAGQVALEGDDDDPNSIFTRALLPLLQEPGLSLPELARRVRNDVQDIAARLGETQRPAYYDEVAGEFLFSPAESVPTPPQLENPCTAAQTDWAVVEGIEDPALLQAFIDVHGACELYSRRAQIALDNLSANGQGLMHSLDVPDNVPEEIRDYVRRAQNGNVEALAALGRIYEEGVLVDQSFAEALRWYHVAAASGSTVAMMDLGRLYLHGRGVEQNDREAMRWYEAAAAEGHAPAMVQIGWMYEMGRGVVESDPLALNWYVAGAEAGDVFAMELVGWRYEVGEGVDQSLEEAIRWYRAAAHNGSASAMNSLGWLYESGSGVEQSAVEALRWYQAAARAGNLNAITTTGWFYEDGIGVERDYDEAAAWYRLGAEGGDPHAMNRLGLLYEQGHGVVQNYADAVYWYERASEQGNGDASFSLARLYELGMGVSRSFEAAADRYLNSVQQGSRLPIGLIGTLERETVVQMQYQLRDLGVYHGAIDGAWHNTVAALRSISNS
jgi:hypothetical protein